MLLTKNVEKIILNKTKNLRGKKITKFNSKINIRRKVSKI